MRPFIVSRVKKGFWGDRLINDSVYDFIKPGITLNEMLHVIHSALMNDLNLYYIYPS